MSGAGAGAVAGRWSRGRADFSHMWTPREVQLCSRIRRCCCCCCCGLCPGLGTASSCIIQQNSEWLFFMGLFISFDHLFQVALSLSASLLPFPLSLFRLLLFCSFHYFYTVSSCLRSKWFRVDGDAKIIIKCSSRVQGPVEASRGGTCHVLLMPCALSIEPKTSDIRPTTHDCPAPLQVTPVSPFLSSQQIETNPHPFVESGNASFDFILCAQSGQQKANKKKK